MSVAPGAFTVPVLSANPSETPDAGKVFLYIVGASYRMKTETGQVFTFATGVSPEEAQDIVGAMIQAGSTRLSVNYDDVNNILILDVVTANILHQGLNGAGSNTHAQIDAHIASTANPHATTKAQVGLGNVDNTSDANKPISTATQTALNGKENTITPTSAADYYRGDKTFQPLNKAAVGLGNVDNTSDANKPISTATQTALNLKYDASNPNGYETPAQLNARDTANRARGNHTGTQLAATISDFASSVLGVLLAGFAVGANTAIAATDSILAAFGKVQGQINFINSVLQTLVLGDQFEQFLDDTTFTTTSGANQVAAIFTTANKPAGLYRIGIAYRWTNNTGTSDSIFGFYVDGVLQDGEYNLEQQDNTTNRWVYQFTYVPLLAGTHTIELRTRNEAAGNQTQVTDVRAEIWRATP